MIDFDKRDDDVNDLKADLPGNLRPVAQLKAALEDITEALMDPASPDYDSNVVGCGLGQDRAMVYLADGDQKIVDQTRQKAEDIGKAPVEVRVIGEIKIQPLSG